ncbi:MAG: hypothetical protein QOG52_758, partial [Frankiaceae bacterium]|nr:hypothetical protein [Frankiaceae bacterium]
YLIAQPHRLKYLDDVLSYILSHDGVWATTGDEIADWYTAHHRDEHLAHIAGNSRPITLLSSDRDRVAAE